MLTKYVSIVRVLFVKQGAKYLSVYHLGASHVVQWVKNPPASAGDARDLALIPGSGRSPGGGSGNPLQYYCLKIPMERRAWWATVYGSQKLNMTE